MSQPEKSSDKGEKKEERVERRSHKDRREATSDRRRSDRIVAELIPRRQTPDRRKD